MKVHAYETKEVEVELTERAMDDVTRETIIEHFDLPDCPEIKAGKLYRVWEEDWGHSSSFEEEVVREATEADIAAVRVLQEMGLTR